MKYDRLERADADHSGKLAGAWPGVTAVQLEREADVFCTQCAKDKLGEEAFNRVKSENFRHDEFGGVSAVLSTSEWDCPGATCGHCGIELDVRVIHYEGVCGEHCPKN